ncbi:MAG: discoidin domain-containing protein, partial [Bacteroidota bacterium]|nr:discoidin domain-containing protein [Bacteroidota bacterium]
MNHLYFSGKLLFILVVALAMNMPAGAQIKYVSQDERRDAGMGVERVARFFTPAYDSKTAQGDDETRWVQIDLGERKKIDGIKLLPRMSPWGYVQSQGFPVHFKIEVSDDPEFTESIMYENQLREDFRDPKDEIITFDGKMVYGRYVRLTATRLRQRKLSFSKIMVL